MWAMWTYFLTNHCARACLTLFYHHRNAAGGQKKSLMLSCYENKGLPKLLNNTKVKWSRYRPSVTQRVGRGIALLFRDRVTRRGWVNSSMPWPHFTPGKDPVPILQEVLTGGKSLSHQDSILDRPASSQSLYQLSYLAHYWIINLGIYW